MSGPDIQAVLLSRAAAASLELDPALADKLAIYYRHLASWNQKINLSGMDLRQPTPEAIDRLLIEPVFAARFASRAARMVDIGSGGGSPAIPFALASGASELVMVESKTRKSVFLREALRAVGLRGDALTIRFEELAMDPAYSEVFDILTIRAVRIDQEVLQSLERLVRPGGHLFLFRSEELSPMAGLIQVESVPLPGSPGTQLIILAKP